jgi:hypothetical protein
VWRVTREISQPKSPSFPRLFAPDDDVMRDIYAMIEKFAVTQSIKRNVLLKKATLSHRQ